jgi:hypothetical protein
MQNVASLTFLSDKSDIATKDSHFVHEGSGLGTFHKTLLRPLHFHCVPNCEIHRAIDSPSAQTYDDASDGCLINLAINQIHSPPALPFDNTVSRSLPSRCTSEHPLSADVSLSSVNDPNLKTAGCPCCYTRTAPASHPIRHDGDHCQVYGCETILGSTFFRLWYSSSSPFGRVDRPLAA